MPYILNVETNMMFSNANQSQTTPVSMRQSKELQRAYSTYLNVTGPGDYQLPKMTANKQIQSDKKNSPMFTF